MRISDWSSDVCSSDLLPQEVAGEARHPAARLDEDVDGAAHLRRPILVVPDDHRRAVAPQDLRPVVQVGLGDHVEGIALALGPDREMAVELRHIGRESCRGRGGQYVLISGVPATLKKKKTK